MNMPKIAVNFLVATLTSLTPLAAWAEVDFHDVNTRMRDRFLVPAYTALATSARHLDESAQDFCTSPDADGLLRLRSRFQKLMDEWQTVQHVTTGPGTFELRRFRMQLWPDKRGNVSRHLDRLIDSRDESALAPDAFTRGSAAIQGLSALEKILYEDDPGYKRFTTGDDGAFRCRLVLSIAANVRKMAEQIEHEWTSGPDPFGGYFDSASHGNAFYESDEDLSAILLRDLRTELQLIVEYKLLRPLGDAPDAIRPRRVESWRSGRSLRNVRINLESIRRAWQSAFAAAVDAPLRARVEARFDSVLEALDEVDDPLVNALADPATRSGLLELASSITALVDLFIEDVPEYLDLNAGMVSLDGD
jgi:predicted lipoprotein